MAEELTPSQQATVERFGIFNAERRAAGDASNRPQETRGRVFMPGTYSEMGTNISSPQITDSSNTDSDGIGR